MPCICRQTPYCCCHLLHAMCLLVTEIYVAFELPNESKLHPQTHKQHNIINQQQHGRNGLVLIYTQAPVSVLIYFKYTHTHVLGLVYTHTHVSILIYTYTYAYAPVDTHCFCCCEMRLETFCNPCALHYRPERYREHASMRQPVKTSHTHTHVDMHINVNTETVVNQHHTCMHRQQ